MQRMTVIVAAVAALLAQPSLAAANQPAPPEATDQAELPDLRQMLMDKFDSMNSRSDGIFHEDVTPAVAAYFPVGQPMAATRKIIAAQKLGALKPFKGTNDPGMGTMFVTRFDLTSQIFSHVYVVLDFDFDGAEPDMRLKAMKAYLRASNM